MTGERRKRLLPIVLTVLALGTSPRGQAPSAAQAATGLIIGKVVDADGGRPVPESVVTLTLESAGGAAVSPTARDAASRCNSADGELADRLAFTPSCWRTAACSLPRRSAHCTDSPLRGSQPDWVIQAQMGHVSPAMMKTYSHIRRKALDDAAKSLEPTFPLEFPTDEERPRDNGKYVPFGTKTSHVTVASQSADQKTKIRKFLSVLPET